MDKRTLARHRLDGAGWAHPYGHGPFGPFLYADGGEGGDSGSGGTGGEPTSGAPGTQGGDRGGQPAGQSAAQPGTESGQSGSDPWAAFQWDGKVDSLPADVAKVIREARDEAGKARTTAKANAANEAREELLTTISKAVGLDGGDKPPTPEELTRQLTQSQSDLTSAREQAASAAIELHVYRTAQRLGANADALLDSRSFAEAIDSLDPGLDRQAFNAAVEKQINEALGRNPELRAQSTGRSGADLSGGTGEGAATKRTGSLAGAISNHYQT